MTEMAYSSTHAVGWSSNAHAAGLTEVAVFGGTSEEVEQSTLADAVMEVIRHAELIVEWFLWTIEHTNRSLDNSNATFRPSRASSGIPVHRYA